MLDQFETITLLGVLEYDGLIHIESGVPRTTSRFQESMVAACRAKRKTLHADLRESISQAMRRLYGKYLTEQEMLCLVDAMLPIAAAEPTAKPARARTRQ
jgi:hypothetical protein